MIQFNVCQKNKRYQQGLRKIFGNGLTKIELDYTGYIALNFAQTLYSYLRWDDRLFDVFFLLLLLLFSFWLFTRIQEKNVWVTEKSTKKNLCERHHFFCLHYLPLMSFFYGVFHLLPLFCLLWLYIEKKTHSKKRRDGAGATSCTLPLPPTCHFL